MNLHTFKDVVNDKKSSLVNELDEGDEEKDVGVLRKPVEGEEEEGDDKFNEAGEVLEPFNLRDERDSGHFDENMNFVFQKEKGEIDAWLADMDEAAMEQSIGEAAKALRLRQQKISEAEAAAKTAVKKSPMELKAELLKVMKPGENVVQTMRRLSGKSVTTSNKGKKNSNKSQNNQNGSSGGGGVVETVEEKKANKIAHRIALEQLTDIVDELLSTGLSGVYNMTYEAIETSSVRWEYRGLDGIIHGPYTPQIIASWKNQGYFSGSSSVMMRKVGVVGREWNDDLTSSTSSTSIGAATSTSTTVENEIASSSLHRGKVRFNFDNNSDGNTENSGNKSKKQKVESKIESTDASAQDLMNDLDSDDEKDEIVGIVGKDGKDENGGASSGNSVLNSNINGNVNNSLASVSAVGLVGGGVTGTVTVAVRIEDEIRGEWTSSDDIDFDVDAYNENENGDKNDGNSDNEADVMDDEDDI